MVSRFTRMIWAILFRAILFRNIIGKSPLLNFLQYLAAWKTHTSLPRWDTESGDSTSQAGSEYNQALAYARRILLPVCAGTQLCFSN
jgi:hypothetical protein